MDAIIEQPGIIAELLQSMFAGTNIAVLGAVLAVALASIGSVKGVGMVGVASSGLLSEDPSKFKSAIGLQALLGTQCIYGLITAFILFSKIDLLNKSVGSISSGDGIYFLFACMPIAIVEYFSAVHKGKIAASGISLIAKRPNEMSKILIIMALIEVYAFFAFLISVILIVSRTLVFVA